MSSLQEVADIPTIQKVIESYFFQIPVFMLYQSKHYPIKPVMFTKQGLVIRSIGRRDHEPRVLFLTNSGNFFQFMFEYKGSKGDLEILFPTKMFIGKASRAGDRIPVYSKVFISNIVNQIEICKSLLFDQTKLNNLIENHTDKLKNKFTNMEVYINDRADTRMRLLLDYEKPIFVPNRRDPESVTEDFIPFQEYFGVMKITKDIAHYSSEICVPLKYKDIFVLGYIVVWNSNPMDLNHFKLVQLTADSIVKDLIFYNFIGEIRDKSYVSDISEEGFSFLRANSKNFSKTFFMGGTLIFDLFVNETEGYTFKAIIRNISPTETSFRIGCQFFLQEEGQKKKLKTVLEKINK
jgi:hypothetical protein